MQTISKPSPQQKIAESILTMTEKDLYRNLSQNLPEIHWTRIENAVGTGMPDVNGCSEGIDFWVELKIGKALLRPAQWAWLKKRARQGGRAFVLAQEDTWLNLWQIGEESRIEETSGGKLEIVSFPSYTFRSFANWKELKKALTGKG